MTAGKGQFGGRRVLEGTVVSDKTEKTVVVAVKSSVRHPLYKKIVRRVRKFMAHDDELHAHMGDVVRIVESRPMSKRKRWRVVEVLFRADLPEVAAESIDLDLLGEVKTEEEQGAGADTAVAAAAPAAEPSDEPAETPADEPATEEPVEESAAQVESPDVGEAVEEVPEPESAVAAAEEPGEEIMADTPEEASSHETVEDAAADTGEEGDKE